jgi:hypothetical protein
MLGNVPWEPVEAKAVPPRITLDKVFETEEWLTMVTTGVIVSPVTALAPGGDMPVISSVYLLRVFEAVPIFDAPWLPLV